METAVDTAADTKSAASPEMISSGQIVAKMLKQEGIKHIFTISGGHIVDIYNGCIDEGIEIVDVRHEQVAAHAADAYARITGLGCAVVTAGPGTTDAVTGMANAYPRREPDAADRRQFGAQAIPHGRIAGIASHRNDDAHQQIRLAGDDHRSRGRNDGHRASRDVQRRARARLPRNPARHHGRQGRGVESALSEELPRARRGWRTAGLHRRSQNRAAGGGFARQRRAPGGAVRHAGANLPRA